MLTPATKPLSTSPSPTTTITTTTARRTTTTMKPTSKVTVLPRPYESVSIAAELNPEYLGESIWAEVDLLPEPLVTGPAWRTRNTTTPAPATEPTTPKRTSPRKTTRVTASSRKTTTPTTTTESTTTRTTPTSSSWITTGAVCGGLFVGVLLEVSYLGWYAMHASAFFFCWTRLAKKGIRRSLLFSLGVKSPPSQHANFRYFNFEYQLGDFRLYRTSSAYFLWPGHLSQHLRALFYVWNSLSVGKAST